MLEQASDFYIFKTVLCLLCVLDPPPGQIAPPDRHVSINGTREAVE